MRFISKTIHAYLDYPVAFALMLLPFVLGLGESHVLALWLSAVTGVAALILTILTDHHLGLIRVIPYSIHKLVDLIVGLTFIAAPFLLGFSGLDMAFYLVNGIAVVIVISLSTPEDQQAMA